MKKLITILILISLTGCAFNYAFDPRRPKELVKPADVQQIVTAINDLNGRLKMLEKDWKKNE